MSNNFFSFDHRVCFMLCRCYRCFFCLIRQLRLLSDNSGNRAAIVEDGSITVICSKTTLHRCTQGQNFSKAVIQRSRGGLSANEKEENMHRIIKCFNCMERHTIFDPARRTSKQTNKSSKSANGK